MKFIRTAKKQMNLMNSNDVLETTFDSYSLAENEMYKAIYELDQAILSHLQIYKEDPAAIICGYNYLFCLRAFWSYENADINQTIYRNIPIYFTDLPKDKPKTLLTYSAIWEAIKRDAIK